MPFALTEGSAGLEGRGLFTIPLTFSGPNPFNPRTRIQFELPHSDAVKLTIHDTLGRRVRTLVSGTHVAGRHQVHWDGRDGGGGSVSSGVYFIRLATSESSLARRILLLR